MKRKKSRAKKLVALPAKSFQAPAPMRVQMLNKASELTSADRNKVYGSAYNNMRHFAGMLSAYFTGSTEGYKFTAEDAAQIMVMAKMSRCKANSGLKFHQDNYVDAAAYSAIAGECRMMEEPIV